MRLKRELIFKILIFVSIGTNFNTNVSYLCFVLMLMLYVFTLKKFATRVVRWDFIATSFLLLWVYGLALGFWLGNKTSYIIANNAGMVLYLTYFIFLQVKLAKETIFQLILWASLSIGLITALIFLFNLLGLPANIIGLLGDSTGGSSTGQRRVYFVSQVTLFAGLGYYLSAFIASEYQKAIDFNVFTFKKQGGIALGLLFITVCIAFFTASKGFMLGFIFLTLFLPLALFFRKVSSGILNVKILYFFILIAVFIGALFSFGYFNIVTSTFDQEDVANLARYEQLYFLMEDLTLFGKGLGSVISNYSRNLEKPYGFELSYLGLLHKFGILGVLAVVLYIITFVKGIKNIIQGEQVKYSVLAVGCLGYLLPSIGNPLMFAPQSVLLHTLALVLLRK